MTNIQPLYKGGYPNGSLPLTKAPYRSRTEDKNVIEALYEAAEYDYRSPSNLLAKIVNDYLKSIGRI